GHWWSSPRQRGKRLRARASRQGPAPPARQERWRRAAGARPAGSRPGPLRVNGRSPTPVRNQYPAEPAPELDPDVGAAAVRGSFVGHRLSRMAVALLIDACAERADDQPQAAAGLDPPGDERELVEPIFLRRGALGQLRSRGVVAVARADLVLAEKDGRAVGADFEQLDANVEVRDVGRQIKARFRLSDEVGRLMKGRGFVDQ